MVILPKKHPRKYSSKSSVRSAIATQWMSYTEIWSLKTSYFRATHPTQTSRLSTLVYPNSCKRTSFKGSRIGRAPHIIFHQKFLKATTITNVTCGQLDASFSSYWAVNHPLRVQTIRRYIGGLVEVLSTSMMKSGLKSHKRPKTSSRK